MIMAIHDIASTAAKLREWLDSDVSSMMRFVDGMEYIIHHPTNVTSLREQKSNMEMMDAFEYTIGEIKRSLETMDVLMEGIDNVIPIIQDNISSGYIDPYTTGDR